MSFALSRSNIEAKYEPYRAAEEHHHEQKLKWHGFPSRGRGRRGSGDG